MRVLECAGGADRARRALGRHPADQGDRRRKTRSCSCGCSRPRASRLPSFVSFLCFLVPLMAIGLGFDAVNGEHNRRTLSRILAQPIYRDALLFGKFFAGLFTLAISLIALWLLVIGLGLLMLGVPPGARGDGARVRLSAGRRSPMPASGWRWRCCSRSCSARRRPRRWSRSGCGCS